MLGLLIKVTAYSLLPALFITIRQLTITEVLILHLSITLKDIIPIKMDCPVTCYPLQFCKGYYLCAVYYLKTNSHKTNNIEKLFTDEILSIKENKLFLQIVIQNNKINYEELSKYSNEIINGTMYINRLSLAEESGRIAGSERNVEASIILTANESANPTK